MRKIVEYNVLVSGSEEFDYLVNKAITNEGWQPFGGVCINEELKTGKIFFAQAMVKYEPQHTEEFTPVNRKFLDSKLNTRKT